MTPPRPYYESGEDWKTEARETIAQGLESARAGGVRTPEEVAAWMAEQKAAWPKRHGARDVASELAG